ncbi:synaptic plasticity regulator PANTS [Hetaerina americana]|uniref:synaptic plasticity regulator PANTS n=1 Tax=Hetaerina americana TaxID=62018 RepID=UPI003A7F1D03
MSEVAEEKSSVDVPYSWLVRPCITYKEEYGDCTSIKGRFHQYFVYGSTVDCNQWGRDLDNCTRWDDSRDMKALHELIESEKKRRTERLQTYINNDVMSLREKPPEDWNKPLPEWMEKEYSSSYLALKSIEMKSKKTEEIGKMCTIL